MKGKDKCEFLKGIRKNIAEANGIPYEPRECTYEGDCTGTCPFCEKEAEGLLTELKKKEAEGAEIKTDLFSIVAMEEDAKRRVEDYLLGIIRKPSCEENEIEHKKALELLRQQIEKGTTGDVERIEEQIENRKPKDGFFRSLRKVFDSLKTTGFIVDEDI